MNFKYLAVFALGAACATIAISQILGIDRMVRGTDRARGHEFADCRFEIPVMQLDVYGGTNSGLTGPGTPPPSARSSRFGST